MKYRKIAFIFLLFASLPGIAQHGLFDSDAILNIKISGNIRELLADRGEKPQYHSLKLSYASDSNEVTIPAQLKTRGHFRKLRSNCTYPPLLINVSKKDQPVSSVFYNEDKIKLVVPCQGEEYVIKEWLAYKLYNVITPKSFKARLVRVTLDDVPAKKQTNFYGILLEDEKKMAKRNKMVSVETLNLRPEYTDAGTFLVMTVFEYMIGNTDWSVQYLQNIKLIAEDSLATPFTIPYDFDHAGIVNAPYARPAEELQMNSVKERRYRGYCVPNMKMFDSTVALFNRLKPDLYKVYTGCTLLNEKNIKIATGYLDEFYSIINSPKKLEREFGYPCDPNGTGNVVIKGMRDE